MDAPNSISFCMRNLRGVNRLFIFVMICLYYLYKAIFSDQLIGRDMKRSFTILKGWAQTICPALGIEVTVSGVPPTGGYLYVANHRSYIDPAVILQYIMAATIAKDEIRKWPLIGAGAKAAHTVFIKRNLKASRKATRISMRRLLERGYSVLIFPEGTTYEGPGTLDLRPGPFQVAEDGRFPIVPIAIEYKCVDDAWVGDDNFVGHFLKAFGKKTTRVHISFGSVIQPTEWEEMHAEAQEWIQKETLKLRERFDTQTEPVRINERVAVPA